MRNILNDQDYKDTLRKIEQLLAKGSQRITFSKISEIRILRSMASEYEALRYDLSKTLQD